MTIAEIILWAAALFNLVIGAPSLLQPGATRDGRVVAVLVLAFGLLYAIAASDPVRFAPVLLAGVLGKLGVIAVMAPGARRGELPRALGWVLAGDALFVAAFVWLLLRG